MSTSLLVVALSMMGATTPPVNSDACREIQRRVTKRATWCEPCVPAYDLAERFAPVLWFSPNEPMLHAGDFPVSTPAIKARKENGLPECAVATARWFQNVMAPNPLPGDAPEDTAVVYYQIDEIKGERPHGCPKGEIDIGGAERIHVRYFFYYRCDAGVNAHVHDLESADFRLAIDPVDGPVDGQRDCRAARLERVKGFAHALPWLENRLHLKPGDEVHLPLTILVEEGKHASCPDRNGDGVFTPGYDVNVRVTEAWGVRDNFGSGLITTKFQASDAKPRSPRDRVVPPTLIDWNDPLREMYLDCGAPQRTSDWGGTYSLREATPALVKQVGDAHASVPGLREEHFGRATQRDSWIDDTLTWAKHNMSLMVRWSQPSDPIINPWRNGPTWPNGASLTVGAPELPFKLPVWLAARATFAFHGRAALRRGDVLLMPTASRWIDTYVALWGKERGQRAQALPEIGLRLRLVAKEPPMPRPLRFLSRVTPMLGLRLGFRLPALGQDDPSARATRTIRLVGEVGGGAF